MYIKIDGTLFYLTMVNFGKLSMIIYNKLWIYIYMHYKFPKLWFQLETLELILTMKKTILYQKLLNYNNPKADPGPALWARTSLFEIYLGFIFVYFDFISRILIVAIIRYLSSTLTSKHRLCVKEHQIKQTPYPKNSTVPGPRAPV